MDNHKKLAASGKPVMGLVLTQARFFSCLDRDDVWRRKRKQAKQTYKPNSVTPGQAVYERTLLPACRRAGGHLSAMAVTHHL